MNSNVMYPPSEKDCRLHGRVELLLKQRIWPLSEVEVGVLRLESGRFLIVNFNPKGYEHLFQHEADDMFKRLIVCLIRKGIMSHFSVFQSAAIVDVQEADGQQQLFRKKIWCDTDMVKHLRRQRFNFLRPPSSKTLKELVTDSWLETLPSDIPPKKTIALPLPP
jgi:hypothetical protein